MNIIKVDFESYYDKDFSLSKLQTDEYILDPQYETIGVSVKDGDEQTKWFSGTENETREWLTGNFDWRNSAVCCHHTLFDGFILTQRYGIRPKLWMDTKAMATHLYPYLRSFSLASLAKHFNLRDKGTYVANMLGRRRESLSEDEMMLYSAYCVLDTEITHELCALLLPRMSPLELRLIDMTVRMFTEPQFIGDSAELRKLYEDEQMRKMMVLHNAGVGKEVLMSNEKLATALRALGVVPPTKVSAKTGKSAWAFAKSDQAFTELLEHDDSAVQALVAARLGVKSTIAETRALTMLNTSCRPAALISEAHLPVETRKAVVALDDRIGSPLPVYLNYWGAKTTGRYSGGNKINWQNLPARGPSAGLRNAIHAPPGCTVVVGDSSNIELRVAMVLAGQTDVVEKITAGVDLYCDFASKMFGRKITKADKKERMLGKIAMLSLQYGAGWRKFKEMVRQQSGEILADSSAEEVVNLYRRVHYKVVDMWNRFDEVVLPEIANGNPSLLAIDGNAWLLCTGEGFGVNGGPGVVYHDLKQISAVDDFGRPRLEWTYEMAGKPVKLYGGKAFENACQYVARMIVMWQTARINERYPVALSVHDEAVCVVPDSVTDAATAYMEECLSMAPPWCHGHIPLACEVGIGPTYGSAK